MRASLAVAHPRGLGAPRAPDNAVLFLVLELFAGIGGAYAIRKLLPESEHGSVRTIPYETDSECGDILASRLIGPQVELASGADSSGLQGSVLALEGDSATLHATLARFSKLRGVLVVGGSPCFGES